MSSSTPTPAATPAPGEEKDASIKQVILYAIGFVESGLANQQFYPMLNTLMIVALGMNPVLLGLILGIKTIWDGIADPVMAQITDNARTRWGRRRPFILVGGLGRILVLILIFTFFPRDSSIKTNAEFAAAKEAAAAKAAAAAAPAVVTAPTVTPAENDSTKENVAAPADTTPAVATSAAPTPPAKPLVAPPKPAKQPGLIESITSGFTELVHAKNPYHQRVAVYLLFACLLFTTFGSIINVPYYALSIELSPSYDGRTQVVTYRSVVEKIMAFVSPWVLPFCFLPMFHSVLDGLFWYAVMAAAIGVPTTVVMVMFIKERANSNVSVRKKGPGIFKSIWMTANNIHFLKILFLYQLIGYVNGLFQQISLILTIYWVYHGDAFAGAKLNSTAASLAVGLAFMSLPAINWACRRFQKHIALRTAIIWMSVGTAMKWFLVTPEHPYLQLVLPFFFSVGISSIFTILPTMMADVTDIDELRTGMRREGMFGAVMGFLSKITGAAQPMLAGAVLVFAGFDNSSGAVMDDATVLRLRLMFSFVPAVLLLFALVILWRYPLTREYMAQVKEQLKARRAAAATTTPAA